MSKKETDTLKDFYKETKRHDPSSDQSPQTDLSGIEESSGTVDVPEDDPSIYTKEHNVENQDGSGNSIRDDNRVLENIEKANEEYNKKMHRPENYDDDEKKDTQNPFDHASDDFKKSGTDNNRPTGGDYESYYTKQYNVENQNNGGSSVKPQNRGILQNVTKAEEERLRQMQEPTKLLPMPIDNQAVVLNGSFIPNIISGNVGLGPEANNLSQTRNELNINTVGTSYDVGGNTRLLTPQPPFPPGPGGGDPSDDPFHPNGIMLNVRATGERRQRLADATGRMGYATGRTFVRQISVNGIEAGAGLGKMLTYTEAAMSAGHAVKSLATGVMSVPHRISIRNQYKSGSLVFKSDDELRSALNMSKADFFQGLNKGTIVRMPDGRVVKKITNRQEYILNLNKQLKTAGVNITINRNLSGYKLEAVAKRYKKRLIAEAERKGLSPEKIAPIIKKLNEAEQMGKSSQLVGSGKIHISEPFKRSFAQFMRTMGKNGSYAGAGLQTIKSYTRTLTQSTKIFVSTVRHGYMLGSLAIKSSKKLAMKAALANIKKHGDAAVISKKIVRRADLKKAKKKAKQARKAAFKKTKLGKIFDKLGNGWGHFRNWTRDPLFIKRGARWIGRKAKNKLVSTKLVKGLKHWASNSKVFHNPVTKFFGKFFNKVGNMFAGVRYVLYKIKQTILLAAGSLLIMIVVASVIFGMIDSVVGSFSFLAVKKSNRDELISAMNDLYMDDMKYMVDQNPTNGITFDNDKDDDLYADQAKEYKNSKKKFEQTTNLAEILSMAYVRFNYDFKHAEYSPSAEAEYNTGLAISSDYDFDSAKAKEGMSWTVPDQAVPHCPIDDHPGGGKLGDEETYTNMWSMQAGHNTIGCKWDISSNPCGKQFRLWKSKGMKVSGNGVCIIDGYYMVACLQRFGNVGDILLVKLDNGTTVPCLIQDTKNPTNDGINPKWGHDHGKCIIESEQWHPHSKGKNQAIIGNNRVVALKNMGSYSEKHKSANELLEEKDSEKKSDDSKKNDSSKKSDSSKKKSETKESGNGSTKKHTSEESNEKKLWNLIKKQGFSDIATAAIVANAYQESKYNPKAENSSGAYGLFQWTNDRRSTLTMIKDYDKMSVQVKYFVTEMKNNYKSCYDKLKKADSTHDAVHTMVYDYEKPGNKDHEVKTRTEKANEIYKKYGTGDDVDATSVGDNSYDSSEDLLTGMKAVKEYVKDLYHGSHQIIVSKDDSGAVTDITYSTKFFGSLFTCGLSQERIVTDHGLDDASSALDGSLYMQDGVIQVPYINQANGWYNEDTKTYSKDNFTSTIEKGKSMQEAGCGLCSTAMAVSYGTGQKVDPINFKAWYTYGCGSSPDIAEGGAKKYGLKSERTGSIDKAIEYLKKGYPVVAHVGGALSKTGGHYLVLTGVKSDGKITMNDPGAQANTYVVTSKEFTKEFIKDNQKGSNSYTAVIPNDDVLSSALNDGSTLTDDQQKILDLAKGRKEAGASYKYGRGHSEADLKNKNLMEFDCSGFASWVYYQAGFIKKSKDSDGWAEAGTAVKSLSEAAVGDILVAGDHHHTGIYIGGNKMIEAPRAGEKIKISKVRKEMSIIRRILKNVSTDSSNATSSVKVGNKTYTASQLKAALNGLGSLGCGSSQCGVWVRRAWSRLAGYDKDKYAGLGTTPGTDSNGSAHSYGVVLGCQSNKGKTIPIGADVIFAYPGGGAGHIGIYIGNDQYISWSGSQIMIKGVKHGNNGLSSHRGYYDGWCWHRSGSKQVVFGA